MFLRKNTVNPQTQLSNENKRKKMGNKEPKLKKIFEDIDNNEDNRFHTH